MTFRRGLRGISVRVVEGEKGKNEVRASKKKS
jgi:hypothetical protein